MLAKDVVGSTVKTPSVLATTARSPFPLIVAMFQVRNFHCEHFRLTSYAVGTEKLSLVTEIPTKENNSKGNVNTVLISTVPAVVGGLVGAGLIVLVGIALRRRFHNEDGDRDASSKQSTTEDGDHSASTDQTVVEEKGAETSAEGPTGNDEDWRGGAAMEQPQDQGGGASTNENLIFELMEMHEDDNQANRAGNATEPGSVLIITSTINAQLLYSALTRRPMMGVLKEMRAELSVKLRATLTVTPY